MWKYKIPSWSKLGKTGNKPIARLVILIPLVGYWIIFNSQLKGWTALWLDPENNVGAPWRLWFTYFGLCAIAIASAFYDILCPPTVKGYTSAEERAKALYDYTSEPQFALIREDIKRDQKWSQYYKDATYAIGPDNKTREDRLLVLEVDFIRSNLSMPSIRLIVALMYALGAIFLALPAFSIFCRVFLEILRSLSIM